MFSIFEFRFYKDSSEESEPEKSEDDSDYDSDKENLGCF